MIVTETRELTGIIPGGSIGAIGIEFHGAEFVGAMDFSRGKMAMFNQYPLVN